MTDTKTRNPVTYDGTMIRHKSAVYDFGAVPASLHVTLAMRHVGSIIRAATNPLAAFESLVDGNVPGAGRAAKPKELDPWRSAVAEIQAEAVAKTQNVRQFLPGGKKLTPEFALILDEVRQQVAAFNADKMRGARKVGAVRARYLRLTGTGVEADVAALFQPIVAQADAAVDVPADTQEQEAAD